MALGIYVGAGGVKEVKGIYVGAGGVKTVKEVYIGQGGSVKKVWPASFSVVNSDTNDMDWYWVTSTKYGDWTQGYGLTLSVNHYVSYGSKNGRDQLHYGFRTNNYFEYDSLDDFSSIEIQVSSYNGGVSKYLEFGYISNNDFYTLYSTQSASAGTITSSISSSRKSTYKTQCSSYGYPRLWVGFYNDWQDNDNYDGEFNFNGGAINSIKFLP